jgi:hypothetical protein
MQKNFGRYIQHLVVLNIKDLSKDLISIKNKVLYKNKIKAQPFVQKGVQVSLVISLDAILTWN